MSASPINPYGRCDPTHRAAWDDGYGAGREDCEAEADQRVPLADMKKVQAERDAALAEVGRRKGIESALIKECNSYASAIGPLTMERDALKAEIQRRDEGRP